MSLKLSESTEFIAAHPVIYERDHSGNSKLKARLAAIGEHEIDIADGVTEISWDPPRIPKIEWTPIYMAIRYPRRNNRSLRQALDAVERMNQRLPELVELWREQIIEHFRWFCEKRLSELGEAESYDFNSEGKVTEQSILAHVTSASFHFEVEDEDDGVEIEIGVNLDWEEEHGIDLEWPDEEEDK